MTRLSTSPLLYIDARVTEVGDDPESLRVVETDTGPRLGYWGEVEEDRDRWGVLWEGRSETLGEGGRPLGRALRGMVHPGRQHRAMFHQHCRLCGLETRLARRGRLYLVTEGERLPDGATIRTAEPPVCLAHARDVLLEPRLRDGVLAVHVFESSLVGVSGVAYSLAGEGCSAVVGHVNEFVPYADKERLGWLVANRAVRDLTSYSEIADLDGFLREHAQSIEDGR